MLLYTETCLRPVASKKLQCVGWAGLPTNIIFFIIVQIELAVNLGVTRTFCFKKINSNYCQPCIELTIGLYYIKQRPYHDFF